MIRFFKRLGAKTRGRVGQKHVTGIVSEFERAATKLAAAERHLAAESDSNITKVAAIQAREVELAKERLRAIRLRNKITEFI